MPEARCPNTIHSNYVTPYRVQLVEQTRRRSLSLPPMRYTDFDPIDPNSIARHNRWTLVTLLVRRHNFDFGGHPLWIGRAGVVDTKMAISRLIESIRYD